MKTKVKKNKIYDFGYFKKWSGETLIQQREIVTSRYSDQRYYIESIESKFKLLSEQSNQIIDTLKSKRLKGMTIRGWEMEMINLRELEEENDEIYKNYRDYKHVMKELENSK